MEQPLSSGARGANVICHPAFAILLLVAMLPGRLAAQGQGAFPTEVLPPVVVPWELGGAKFKRHTREQDSAPFPPHRITGNVYYVGQADYASYLITTPQGHILIDATFESEVPLIRKSVEQLKFRFEDIRILLISHAHRDHAGGARRVKELTGAQLMVMDSDVKAVETGGPDMPPVKVDRILHDQDEITLGGVKITAFRTPGHTPGNTTYVWKASQSGSLYTVVVMGSLSSSARTLASAQASGSALVEDYRYTFRFLKNLPCDIFLGSHGKFFDLHEKYEYLLKGGANPYVDPNGYRNHIKLMEQSFYYKLDAAQRPVAR
jgi:metallo-beta-lactamase class B